MVGEASVKPEPEQERTVNAAWIFDVDGTITNLEKKEVTDPEIFEELIKRLKAGKPIALITGRALKWVIEKVVSPLESKVKKTADLSLLDNFYVSAEFGGFSLQYKDGQRKQSTNPQISVSKKIINGACEIVGKSFADIAFVDLDKKTHFTAEMNNGLTVNDFKPRQKDLTPLLKRILEKYDKDGKYELHIDRIATNIRSKKANKSFAISQVIEWLSSKRINPQKYIIFGDATSDLEMAEEVKRRGVPFEFVFVGEENIDPSSFSFTIHQTQDKFEKGTLEFLESL